jgi:hypothetical protein
MTAPASAHGARRWVAFGVVVVVMLLLGELAARALDSRLPEPLVWHTAEAQAKVAQMDRYAASGGAEIVLAGTSIVMTGVEPAIIDQAVGKPATYNAALSSGIPLLTEPWVLDVVVPRLHPKLLIVGLSSFDFSDDPSSKAFAEAFLSSPGGIEATHRGDFLDTINRWVTDHSQLWAHRFTLRDPAALADALRGKGTGPDPEVAALQANGRGGFGQDLKFGEATIAAGAPVGSWKVGTENLAALRTLIAGAKANGTTVVLVDMPTTDEYISFHPHKAADYATFLTAFRAFAADQGVKALEFDTMRDHLYFADATHLNRIGSQAFTARLVEALKADHLLDGL